MNELITIIIPCYNVEKTVSRCLDSIFANTYKNIEIICINDGSADNTLRVLESYSKSKNNLVVLDQDNHRQGYCRNRGLEISRGEYIVFVDADDYIENTYLEHMVTAMNDSDIVICNYNNAINDKSLRDIGKHNIMLSLEEFWAINLVDPVWAVVPWNKMFRKNVLKNVRFRENVYYEDEFFATDVFSSKSLKIKSINDYLYNYCANPNGTMHTNDVYRKLYRCEARIVRSSFFLDNRWNEPLSRTLKDTVFSVLGIRNIAKKNKVINQYKEQITRLLDNINIVIKNAINSKIHLPMGLLLYSKNRFLFACYYKMRKLVLFITGKSHYYAP